MRIFFRYVKIIRHYRELFSFVATTRICLAFGNAARYAKDEGQQ
jgi:hypothetical protein